MKLRAFLPLGLVALTVLAYAAQGIVLKRTPKEGDKATYKVTGKISVNGLDIGLSGTTTDEVTKVDDKTFTVKTLTKMKADVGGAEQDVPDAAATTTSNLDGTVVKLKQGDAEPDAIMMRLAHLNALILTDKSLMTGDTWVYEGKKDDKAGTPGFKVTYKLVGDEKVGKYDTYHINAVGGETEGEAPTKIKIDYWILKTNGDMIQQKSELTDVVYSAQLPTPVSGTMDVVRQD